MRLIPLSNSRAFTLLEVLAVVFIVGLIAALVFPSFAGPGSAAIRSDARRVAALLRYLNESGIARKETYPLSFSFTDGTLEWKDPDGEKSERIRTLSGVDLQSRGEIHEGRLTVFFSPVGMQEYIEVHLRDGERKITVAFNPVSGRPRILADEK